MSDTEIKAIQGDLDAATAIAAKDAAIASLSQQRDSLTGQLNQAMADLSATRQELAQMKIASMPPEEKPLPPGTPKKIRLLSPHGFIDDNGRARNWNAGDVISTGQEIALLVGRGAEHEVLEA